MTEDEEIKKKRAKEYREARIWETVALLASTTSLGISVAALVLKILSLQSL